jgi:aryl-alcohol dehydrogenase-like predicted oxidoreductase
MMEKMRYRKLGRTNMEVGEIGYGAWGIGGKQWLGGSDEESVAALEKAIELGLNFIDTALAYGDGHSEKLVGKVAKGAPKKIFIATKVPPQNRLWPARPQIGIEEVFPYKYIVECTEQSLRNLGVERLDLQQLHVWNPEWIKSDEWRRAFQDLKKSGKVGAVGVSINDHQPDSALELVETGLIDTVQVIYNIFDQTPERHLFPAAQKKNVGVIARVPFDEGSLAGAITENTKFERNDFRSFYFRGDRKKEVVEHVKALQKDLGSNEGPLAEVALRFCISNPAVSTVIPGMRTRRNVEANCAVSDKGALPDKTLAVLKKHAWQRNFYGS